MIERFFCFSLAVGTILSTYAGESYYWQSLVLLHTCRLDLNRLITLKFIDAYSRYIIWIHVGISTRTAVAVLRSYLDHLSERRTLPYTIHSDRGTETHMMANAHCQLHQELNPDTTWSDHYWYGTSTANQRIESWWRHMSKDQTIAWKVYI